MLAPREIDMAKFKKTEEAEEIAYQAARLTSIETGFKKQTYIHRNIRLISEWGVPDDKYFSRFRFAINPMDNSFILLITMSQGNIKAIPFSTSDKQNLAAVTNACSNAEPLEGSRNSSLHEDLTIGFERSVQEIIDRWYDGDLITHEDFITCVSSYVPHMMLKNLKWVIGYRVKRMSDEHDDEKETNEDECGEKQKDGKRLFKRPEFLDFVHGKDTIMHPIEFLVYYAHKLVSMESMCAPMPAVYSNDPSVPAMMYLDLDSICSEGPCPTWDTYMKRYRHDHGEAFMAYIWSIFDASNTSRQMLYIVDNGYTGKSFVMSCLIELLGTRICASLQRESLEGHFGMAKVWDKRLVVIGDNKNKNLLRQEKMHIITGGDYADIEMKGKNSFPARIQCKVVASGNIPLEINPDAQHETSRLIQITTEMTDDIYKEFCLVDENGNLRRRPDGSPIPKGDPSFKVRLKAEFPQFLTKCREVYSRLCPNGADIIISDEMYMELKSLASTSETSFGDFFDRNFEYSKGHMIPWKEFQEIFRTRICDYSSDDRRNPLTIEGFKDYVNKKFQRKVQFGVARKFNGKSSRVVTGLKVIEWDERPYGFSKPGYSVVDGDDEEYRSMI